MCWERVTQQGIDTAYCCKLKHHTVDENQKNQNGFRLEIAKKFFFNIYWQ
jgi:hypothetical protein